MLLVDDTKAIMVPNLIGNKPRLERIKRRIKTYWKRRYLCN
jgi:hypothetical protein